MILLRRLAWFIGSRLIEFSDRGEVHGQELVNRIRWMETRHTPITAHRRTDGLIEVTGCGRVLRFK